MPTKEHTARASSGSSVPALKRSADAAQPPSAEPEHDAGQTAGETSRGRRNTVLNQRLLEAAEKERRAVGREIHDGLGQQLHALQYLAGLLKQDLADSNSPYASDAARLARLLSETMIMARHLANGLQPVMPLPEGLVTALRELARRTSEVYGVECTFDCPRPVPLADVADATHLYRIAQEGVNNAVRHAVPRHIQIILRFVAERLVLRVTDDGSGIKTRRSGGAGMGLHIMRQRAGLLAGTFQVLARPGGGTAVVVSVPRPVGGGSDHPFGDAI